MNKRHRAHVTPGGVARFSSSTMRTGLYLVGSLLWCLVNSQTVPYVSFSGDPLLNHGYVDLSLVGEAGDGSDSVQCHTDLMICCREIDSVDGVSLPGGDRPNWFFPNGTEMDFSADGDDIYQDRGAQRNDLRRRNNVLSPSGIYRCVIPIDDGNGGFVRETVYVGIYASGGAITISGDVTFAMISDDEFTLTCISTGGPATTVTWTRDSQTAVGTTNTVLNDKETAQYTHTLSGTLTGEYTCSVSNNRPSADSSSYTVQVASAPTDVTAVQDGPTSILVSWSPPDPLGDTTGYRIDYTDGSSSNSVSVSDGSVNQQSVTGLNNGDTYTISIVATSVTSLPSESVEADMTVSLVPARPSLNTNPPTTATSISLSWNVADSVVTSSLVSWQRDTSECPDEDEGSTPVTDSSTSTTISEREENSRYFITVTVSNDAGSSEVSNIVTAETEEAAPSAAPTDVRATSTSTTITVQWGPVECIERNGVITGYSVQYWIQDQSTQTKTVLGDSSGGSYEITGLQSSTTYFIRVAAITGASHIGPYSSIITEVTSGILLVSVDSSSTTSLTILWTLDEGVTGTSYTISYENTNTDCFTMTYEDITTSVVTHELTGLEEGTEYSITVTTTLTGGGGTVSDTLTASTITVAPSVAPSSVSATNTSSTVITVQWEMVPCIHRNGYITGYSVRYTGGGSIDSMPVAGGSVMEATISGLIQSTTYSIQVAAVNSAGTGDYSYPLIVATHSQSSDSCPDDSRTDTAAVIGGVVVAIVLISLGIIVIVVLVLRSRRGQYTTGPSKREAMPPPGATNTVELKFSGEPTYVDPDVIPTSSNEAYHTVSQTGGTTTDYEAVSDPHTVPPSTSHSSQPPTAGDYEQV